MKKCLWVLHLGKLGVWLTFALGMIHKTADRFKRRSCWIYTDLLLQKSYSFSAAVCLNTFWAFFISINLSPKELVFSLVFCTMLETCERIQAVGVLCYTSCIAVFYFRCRTASYKSVFGRSCDRPSRHRVFLGFSVPKSKCWYGSQDSKLPLYASHVALPT